MRRAVIHEARSTVLVAKFSMNGRSQLYFISRLSSLGLNNKDWEAVIQDGLFAERNFVKSKRVY